ncbi:MAG TPA: hypothetical protein VN755_00925 [Steroidobacteraceae bacterium]|nr:hypothetical protein [Steroidobacteraceae bacterium]
MLLDDLEAEPRMTVVRLEECYRRHCLRKNFTREVAEAVASGSAPLERAGAWLLVRVARETGGLAAADWEIVVDGLAGVRAWTARLQLCQLLTAQPALADAAPAEIADFVRSCAADPKPFVRAWGISAFHALGRHYPRHRAEARRWLARGRRDPAKSVQARMRRLA